MLKSDNVNVNPVLWNYYQNVKGNYRRSDTSGYRTGEVNPSEYTSEVKNSYR